MQSLPHRGRGRNSYVEYQHRACKACSKRIPRWTDGKPTPKSKVFCGPRCAQFYRRLHLVKGVTENAKKRPILRAFVEPVRTEVARPEWRPCQACGQMRPFVPDEATYCNDRCRDYVPLPPRKAGGAWFTVAGPVDYCCHCGLAIVGGFLRRGKDNLLSCDDCARAAQ